jgi:beta-barrel assembly-enhancing protease
MPVLHALNMRRFRPSAITGLRRLVLPIAVALTAASAGCVASTQQELKLGADYAAQIDQQLPIVRDPESVRYINVLGDSIARVSDSRGLQWQFSIVDQPEINAFAVPGGYIYVNRGLIERAKTMSELAGVLGHEIAHVTQRHSMQQMAKNQQASYGALGLCVAFPSFCNSGLGNAAIQYGGGAVFAKFSRNDETDADRFGVTYVTRAGIDPRGMPSMFRTLLAERKANPSALEAWFASHPMEEDRVAVTEREIGKIDPIILKTLTRDTPAFQRFKARLATLPRTPAKAAR